MDQLDLNRERRRQRAFERLGANNPRCPFCGCDNPLALELHHIAGQTFDDMQVPVCRNCHRRLSDYQKDHSLEQGKSADELEPIRRFMEGLADLFELLVKRLREYAAKLGALDSSTNGEAQS